MKKYILLFLFVSSFMNAQITMSEKDLKFNQELKTQYDSFKETPITSEEIRNILIEAIGEISKATTDPTLKEESKTYLEKIKIEKLVQNKRSDLSKLPSDLLKKFNQETDDFNLITFITHKKASRDPKLYIGVKNDSPYLKFVWTYRGYDWVFIKKMIFLIDGQNYEYIPVNVKRDVILGSGVTERVEDTVKPEMLPLLNAIANTTSDIKVRFEGDKISDETYSKKIGIHFKETLQLYNSF